MDVLAHYLGVMLGAVIATLIAAAMRRASRSRFWSRVAQDAERMLHDPTHPADTPDAAAQSALVEAQRTNVARVATTIANGNSTTKPS